MLNDNNINIEISASEKLQCFLKKNGFYLMEDDHTVTLYFGHHFVAHFSSRATAQNIWRAAADYLGEKVQGER